MSYTVMYASAANIVKHVFILIPIYISFRNVYVLMFSQVWVQRIFCFRFDVALSVQVCGEHRESGILRQGFLASPFLPEQSREPNRSELIQSSKGYSLDLLLDVYFYA